MKQTILDLIAANPNIRTVEISDRLDIDLEMVRPHIADEIRSGEIVEEPILAPNGRTVLSFRRADAAPKVAVVTSPVEARAALPARVVRAMPPAVRKMLAPPQAAPAPEAKAESSTPLEIDVQVTRKEGVPLAAEAVPAQEAKPRREGVSRVERGLALLRAQHPAPVLNPALMEAMDLPTRHSPYSYMHSAIKGGRALYENRKWTLGPVELAKLEQPAAVEQPAPAVSVRQEQSDTAPATGAEWVARAEPDGQVEFTRPAVADKKDSAAAAWVAEAQDEAAAPEVQQDNALDVPEPASLLGGLPLIGRQFLPADLAPLGSRDFSSAAVYGMGQLRTVGEKEPLRTCAPARDAAAERFLAGVMSDGSLHLRIPGREPFDLEPAHARALWELMRVHGYAAWQTT